MFPLEEDRMIGSENEKFFEEDIFVRPFFKLERDRAPSNTRSHGLTCEETVDSFLS